MTKNLKPCPFCGSEVEVNSSAPTAQVQCSKCNTFNQYGTKARDLWNKRTRKETNLKLCPICGSVPVVKEAYGGKWCVQCPKCTLFKLNSTREGVIQAWNKRSLNSERNIQRAF